MSTGKRFNFCDIILIVALLATILSFVLRKPLESMLETVFFHTNVLYTVEADAETFDISKLESGTVIYNSENKAVGTVDDISAGNNVKIIINADALTDKTGTYVENNMFIAPGLNISLHTEQGYFFNCIVKKVQTH